MAGVDVKIARNDPDTDLLTYATIRLYRDTTPGGAFSTLVDSATLVSGTYSYTINDPTGDGNRYYRFRLYNSVGPVQSNLSEVIPPAALTMLRLRVQAATQAGAGWAGTCSDTGDATHLRDVTLLDNGVDPDFERGAWIYLPDAATSDMLRRVAASDGFDSDTGDLSPVSTRPWGAPPADGDVYHVFNYFPPTDAPGSPYSWDRAIRDGLADVWFVDQLTIETGDSTSTRRFDLSAHAAYVRKQWCRRVLLRTEDSNGNQTDFDASTNGWFWQINENVDGRALELELPYPPTSEQTVILEVNRQDTQLYLDTDIVACPEDVAVAATVRAAFRWLNEIGQPGKYARELLGADAAFWRVYTPPTAIVRGL